MTYTRTVHFPDFRGGTYMLTAWREGANDLARFTLRHDNGEDVDTMLENGDWYAAFLALVGRGFAPEVILRNALRDYDAGRPGVDATV